MKKISPNNNLAKILFISSIFIIITVVYSFFAFPVYRLQKGYELIRFYHTLQNIDLMALDDETEDIIEDISPDRTEIAITDSDWNIIYTNKHRDSESFIQRNIIEAQTQFTDSPVINAKKWGNFQIIRIQATFEQNGQKYYLYVREEIRSAKEIIEYTTYYLFFCFLMITLLYSFWIVHQFKSVSKKQETLEHQFQEKQKDFIANISHELKTPLAVISSQLELLEAAGTQIDRTYYYASIHEEIDKMSSMIGDLLDISTAEYRIENMEKSSVNLSETMEYLLIRYDSLFKRNSLTIHTSFTPNCYVWGNQAYLEQAINNYLMNAFQHTARGNTISVTLSVVDSMAKIEVYNEGDPIPKEQLDSIWEGFYSSHKKNNPVERKSGVHFKNAGLGLYTVKKIVQQHDGKSGVTNQKDGVTFWIELPVFK